MASVAVEMSPNGKLKCVYQVSNKFLVCGMRYLQRTKILLFVIVYDLAEAYVCADFSASKCQAVSDSYSLEAQFGLVQCDTILSLPDLSFQ